MKPIILKLLFLGLISCPSFAGQLYGRILMANRPVADAKIDIVCGNETKAAMTDRNGSYRINMVAIGKCTMTVTYNNVIYSYASAVYSYNKPVRYDFELQQVEGRRVLRRR